MRKLRFTPFRMSCLVSTFVWIAGLLAMSLWSRQAAAAASTTPAAPAAPAGATTNSGTLSLSGSAPNVTGTLTISGPIVSNSSVTVNGSITNNGSPLTINGNVLVTNTATTGISPALSRFFDIELGLVTLQSYSISRMPGGTLTLNNGSTTARGMAQFEYKNRYAWRNTDSSSFTNQPQNDAASVGFIRFGDLAVTDLTPMTWDFEAQGGFAFGGPSSQGASVAGAGDAFAEFSAGPNLFKERGGHAVGQQPYIWTANPELFGGFVTDGGFAQVHPNGGFGLAYVAGIPLDNTKPPVEFMGRAGYAWVDSVVLQGGVASNGNSIVKADSSGNPLFHMKGGTVFTLETHIPMNATQGNTSKAAEYGYLSAGGTFYRLNGDGRDPWFMYVSYSISPEGLFQLFGPVKPNK